MMFFQSSRPRRFHHEYMFVDERKEALKRLEERAQKAVGGDNNRSVNDRDALRQRLSGALQPNVLRDKHNKYTAMWVSLILSAGVILLLILCLFIF